MNSSKTKNPFREIALYLGAAAPHFQEEILDGALVLERLKDIFNHISVGFVVFDKDFNYVYVSEMAGEHMMRDPKDLVGKNNWVEFPEAVGTKLYHEFHRSLHQQVPVQFELYYPPVDRWAEFQAYPSKDGLFVFAREVSDRKRAEEALRESQQRLELAQVVGHIGTFEWDVASNKSVGTEQLGLLYGFAPGELGNTFEAWLQCIHPEDRERVHRECREAVEKGSEIHSEFRIVWPDQSVHWILSKAKAYPEENGRPLRVIGVNIEITQQKLVEQKILQANQELKRLDQLRSEFTSMISHELRTPLAAIKEGIDLILDGIDGPVSPGQQETLAITKNNVDRLARLIGNVLDFSKIESGLMQTFFELSDLNSIVSETFNFLKVTGNKKGVNLSLEIPQIPISAVCDADKIRQILINLLDNAIKFTKTGGSIVVRLMGVGDEICIEVEDTGIGIKSEDQQKIFGIFRQSTNKGMWKTGGVGVGLAVCKKLIEQHNGRIAVSSFLGKGSKFQAIFPANLAQQIRH